MEKALLNLCNAGIKALANTLNQYLEIGAHGYGLKKDFNDDNEVQLYLHEMPKDIVNGSPEEFDNYVSVEEGILTVKYEPEKVINFMYNEI